MRSKDNIEDDRPTTAPEPIYRAPSGSPREKPDYDGLDLLGMFETSAVLMERNVGVVNRLNVYPVPDGDTGVNMFLTLNDSVASGREAQSASAAAVSEAMAKGALLAGRGNSGVILSQCFRGIADAFKGKERFDPPALAAAFARAAVHAYSAIGHPTEGTILTVMREAGDRGLASDSDGLARLLENVCDAAYDAVELTPTLLPTLRRAGLVDAGGYGLYIILEGMHLWAQGESPDTRQLSPPNPPNIKGDPQATGEISEDFLDEIETEEYGSCTQFVVQGDRLDIDSIRVRMLEMGQSSVVIGDSQVVRVHVHAADPDPILAYGESLGEVSQVNVQDMDEQRREYSQQRREELDERGEGAVSVVAVARGQGIEAVFEEYGVSRILQGGDTMNPSVGQILAAVEDAPTNDVLLLPNNPNILSAANQAVQLTSKNLAVVPSLTIPQGITAMLEFDSSRGLTAISGQMEARLGQVRTGEVCTAVRTVQLDGVDVAEGQIIGLLDRELVASGDLPSSVLLEVLRQGVTDATEVVTLFWGQDVAEQEAVELCDAVADGFDGVEFELVQGGQPYYHYLVSIE